MGRVCLFIIFGALALFSMPLRAQVLSPEFLRLIGIPPAGVQAENQTLAGTRIVAFGAIVGPHPGMMRLDFSHFHAYDFWAGHWNPNIYSDTLDRIRLPSLIFASTERQWGRHRQLRILAWVLPLIDGDQYQGWVDFLGWFRAGGNIVTDRSTQVSVSFEPTLLRRVLPGARGRVSFLGLAQQGANVVVYPGSDVIHHIAENTQGSWVQGVGAGVHAEINDTTAARVRVLAGPELVWTRRGELQVVGSFQAVGEVEF